MRNRICIIHKSRNFESDASAHTDSLAHKVKDKSSVKKYEWTKILSQIKKVTRKVQKLYEEESSHKRRNYSLGQKKMNGSHHNSSKKSDNSQKKDFFVNSFQSGFQIQTQIANKNEVRTQLPLRNNRKKSTKKEIRQQQNWENKYLSFVSHRNSLNQNTSQVCCFQNQQQEYDLIMQKFLKLEKSHQALFKQNQLLLQKLYEENRQNKKLQNLIKNISEQKKQTDLPQNTGNKTPISKSNTFFLSDSSTGFDKQNSKRQASKKYQERFSLSANVNPDSSYSLNLIKNSQAGQYVAVSEAFTSKFFENKKIKQLPHEGHNTESLLIDLSNRSSMANKLDSMMKNEIRLGEGSSQQIELQRELFLLLERSKTEKNQKNTKELWIQICEVLSRLGFQQTKK